MIVATVLTACGIETCLIRLYCRKTLIRVATVLTACGIETSRNQGGRGLRRRVATVLTACGIETFQLLFRLGV